MCRLMAYFGTPILAADLVTKPSRSIITQSFDARERMTEIGYLNGDGFGLGWYAPEVPDDPTPCVFRSLTPAWNNANLYNLTKKVKSPIIFAHVRAATPGDEVQELNCHPFHKGRYMFMHNGMVGGLAKVRRDLMSQLDAPSFEFAIKHSSDSGLCFALLLNELGNDTQLFPTNVLRDKVEVVVNKVWKALDDNNVQDSSLLNFVISDGTVLIATRVVRDPNDKDADPASLYLAAGVSFQCKDETADDFEVVQSGKNNYAAIIASEPLTDDHTDWLPIPKNHITVILEGVSILSSPMNLPSNKDSETSDRLNEITQCLHFLTENSKESNVRRSDTYKELGLGNRPLNVDECDHTLVGHDEMVLCIAHSGNRLISGSQDATISVWDLDKFLCIYSFTAHEKSILALKVHENMLISSSSDRTIKLWDLTTYDCLGVLPALNVGPMLSICVVDGKLYQGCQDCYIFCTPLDQIPQQKCTNKLDNKSVAQDMRKIALIDNIQNIQKTPQAKPQEDLYSDCFGGHCGFVFALVSRGKYLLSGGGDGSVKVWNIENGKLEKMLLGHSGGIHDIVIDEVHPEFFSASADNTVKLWDLDSLSCRRTLIGHQSPVLSIALSEEYVCSGSVWGNVFIWNRTNYDCKLSFRCVAAIHGLSISKNYLIAASSDKRIGLWDIDSAIGKINSKITANSCNKTTNEKEQTTNMSKESSFRQNLTKLIGFKSISSEKKYNNDCWECAKFLCTLIDEMGGSSRLFNPIEGCNPVVCAKIGNDPNKKTVLMYGHYDVQPASEPEWKTNPWQLTSINNFYYGRGTSDDKGPILSSIYAVFELLNEGKLPVNVIFAYEGEVETSPGSIVFCKSVEQNYEWFAGVDVICVCNNYWIGEDRPCITYGMRGNLNVAVEVDGFERDLHSGVDGGVVVEPLTDLIGVMASLIDGRGMVLVPGFYDGVQSVTDKELKLYEDISFDVDEYKKQLGAKDICTSDARETLLSRWREPSLSVTNISTNNVTAEGNYTLISRSAIGHISIRYVPNQTSGDLVRHLTAHLRHEFAKRHSPNILKIRVVWDGPWWLADAQSPIFQAAGKAIEEVWNVQPLYVREGGTMAITSFLERKLGAPALHLPLGASSCNAHLPNERIGIENLEKGKEVLKKFFANLCQR